MFKLVGVLDRYDHDRKGVWIKYKTTLLKGIDFETRFISVPLEDIYFDDTPLEKGAWVVLALTPKEAGYEYIKGSLREIKEKVQDDVNNQRIKGVIEKIDVRVTAKEKDREYTAYIKTENDICAVIFFESDRLDNWATPFELEVGGKIEGVIWPKNFKVYDFAGRAKPGINGEKFLRRPYLSMNLRNVLYYVPLEEESVFEDQEMEDFFSAFNEEEQLEEKQTDENIFKELVDIVQTPKSLTVTSVTLKEYLDMYKVIKSEKDKTLKNILMKEFECWRVKRDA